MILLRLLFVLTAITLAVSGGMYAFTHERRYLSFAAQLARFVAFLLLILGALFLLERYVLVGWGILI